MGAWCRSIANADFNIIKSNNPFLSGGEKHLHFVWMNEVQGDSNSVLSCIGSDPSLHPYGSPLLEDGKTHIIKGATYFGPSFRDKPACCLVVAVEDGTTPTLCGRKVLTHTHLAYLLQKGAWFRKRANAFWHHVSKKTLHTHRHIWKLHPMFHLSDDCRSEIQKYGQASSLQGTSVGFNFASSTKEHDWVSPLQTIKGGRGVHCKKTRHAAWALLGHLRALLEVVGGPCGDIVLAVDDLLQAWAIQATLV